MAPALDGCIAKLNRAEEQLHAIKDAVNEFRSGQPFDPSLEIDRKDRPTARAVNVRYPDQSLSVMVGECAFNMRSALDHLAYQLALQHMGDPLPPKIARATSFPIFRTGPAYRRFAPSKVQGMSRQARAVVERVQPYHRFKRPMAVTLQWLDEICNTDKHRGLHPTASMLVSSQFRIQSKGRGQFVLRGIETFPGPLTERAIVARFIGVFEGDVSLEQHIITDVVFDRDSEAPSVRGQSVVLSLAAIRDFIALDAMPELVRLFTDAEYEVKVGDYR